MDGGMRSLPLESAHRLHGAHFGRVADWRLPLDYGDAAAEQRAVRTAVGFLDESAKGKVRVEGPDRLAFLDGLLTNDLKALTPGQGLYAATLDHKGRVRGDMVVYDAGDHYILGTEPEAGGEVLAYLNSLLVSDDVTMTDVTEGYGVFGVFGPGSADVVARVSGVPPPIVPYAYAEGARGSIAVARSPAFGGEGYDVWVPAREAEATARALLEDAVPFGYTAAEALRIESGRPKFPVDMNEETLALEARLELAISTTKGCYVGQEIVSRATHIGQVHRLLIGLEVDGEPPARGAEVAADGRRVGAVTSAARSASLGKTVALGYVRRENAAPGTRLTVGGDAAVPARVAELPFLRP